MPRTIKRPEMFMHCARCGRNNLLVGINEDRELILECSGCDLPVAVIKEWPDKEMLAEASCAVCGKPVDKPKVVN